MDPAFPELGVLMEMITPAVLISACGTLLLSTSTRLARVVDRVHDWSDQLEAIARDGGDDEMDRDKRMLVFAQLDETARRARLLQLGMTAYYLAIGVFVADIVVIGLVALGWWNAGWATIAFGLSGTALLLVGSALLIAESRLALETTEREMDYLRRLGERRVPAEQRARPLHGPLFRHGRAPRPSDHRAAE